MVAVKQISLKAKFRTYKTTEIFKDFFKLQITEKDDPDRGSPITIKDYSESQQQYAALLPLPSPGTCRP